LYVYNSENIFDEDFYSYLYIMDDKYIADKSPISSVCDCFCCKNYSKSYLQHLFSIGDPLSLRLSTIHNLRFYTTLMELLRGKRL
ncbi:MAG: tRNA-guanine transglycosylase, partial [Oscillospiraceae bacterium]|nr:tRNA-guanine transglycosylase [Oscillospiraceae bacterium]